MKKNNVKTSQRGLKRDAKNKARLKRAKALREFNALVRPMKERAMMEAWIKQQEEERKKQEEANKVEETKVEETVE
jgi:hypothetical protein